MQFNPKMALSYLQKQDLDRIKVKASQALNFGLHDTLYGGGVDGGKKPSSGHDVENIQPSKSCHPNIKTVDGRPRAKKVVDQKHLDMLESERPKRELMLPLDAIYSVSYQLECPDDLDTAILAPVDDYRKHLSYPEKSNPARVMLELEFDQK